MTSLLAVAAVTILLSGCTKPTPEEQMAMGAGEIERGSSGPVHSDMETEMGTENLVEGTLDYLDEGDSSSSK